MTTRTATKAAKTLGSIGGTRNTQAQRDARAENLKKAREKRWKNRKPEMPVDNQSAP